MNDERDEAQDDFDRMLAEARDPAATPDVLKRIHEGLYGTDADRAHPVRRAVMAHPNLPLPLLADLMNDYPQGLDAALANPVLPLLLLEDPAFLDRLHWSTLLALLAHAELPAAFLDLLVAHPWEDIASAARRHVAVAGEAGEGWHDELLQILADLPCVPARRRELHTMGLWPEAWVSLVPARTEEEGRTLHPVRLWEPAFFSAENCVRDEVPTPPGGWKTLTRRHEQERTVWARNPVAPPEALLALAGDRNDAVRLSLVRNPATPPQALLRLMENPLNQMPEYVAAHPNATTPVLARLIEYAGDYDVGIALRILLRPEVTPETLQRLARSQMEQVREMVRSHPAARSAEVAERLRQGTLQDAALSHEDPVLSLVATLHAPTPEMGNFEEEHAHWLKRLAVALHPNTPPDVRQALAERDGDRYVRAAARQPPALF